MSLMMIKPHIVLLSAVLLPEGQLYIDDDLFSELNGVTLEHTLYIALGNVPPSGKSSPIFATKIQEVMALRYGLYDSQWRSIKDISKTVGMTRQCIYKIQKHVLGHLRQPKWRDILQPYVKPGVFS
jgi:hypothetical protein